MQTAQYEFRADGVSKFFNASSNLDAFKMANEAFSEYALESGCWMETMKDKVFLWVEMYLD